MLASPPTAPADYDDTILFGYMIEAKETKDASDPVDPVDPATPVVAPAAKKQAAKKDSNEVRRSYQERSSCSIIPGYSTSYFEGNAGFAQGHVASREDLMPFTFDRHLTRYCYTVCLDLGTLKARPQAVRKVLSAMQGILVGGNQSSNRCAIVPEVLVWHVHEAPASGLQVNEQYLNNFAVDLPITEDTLKPMREKCLNLGVTFEVAGLAGSPTVAEALTQVIPNHIGF